MAKKFNRTQWRSFSSVSDLFDDDLLNNVNNYTGINSCTDGIDSNTRIGQANGDLSLDKDMPESSNSQVSDCEFDYEFDQYSTDSDGSVSDNDAVDKNPSLLLLLRDWYASCHLPRAHMTALLSLLRKFHPELPADPRTLSQVPRSVDVKSLCGGQYFYFGLGNVIRSNMLDTSVSDIVLQISVDGIPLYKSSSQQFWPISISINSEPPCFIALYYGIQKPNSRVEFTKDFVEEFQSFSGLFTHKDRVYPIRLTAVIADAPARSFLKNIVGHNGYHSCERCQVVGQRIDNTTVFLESDCASRTDVAFDEMAYEDHHQNGPSPFIGLLGCVTGFSLDYMHLVCLGAVRRMLTFWRKETFSPAKLSQAFLRAISKRLSDLSGQLPSEFARQPRSLLEVDRWKAVEFRQFLLYTGPVVLQNILTGEHYNHFCALMVACSILMDVDSQFRELHLDYARQLLLYFVEKAPALYGKRFVTYNIHSLIHLADDCEHHKLPLHALSAFPFENSLGQLKRLVKNAKSPIVQVVKKISLKIQRPTNANNWTRKLGVLPKDCYVLLKSGQVAIIQGRQIAGNLKCQIVASDLTESLFNNPLNSSEIGIVKVSTYNLSKAEQSAETTIHTSDIARKLVALHCSQESMTVFIPLKGNTI